MPGEVIAEGQVRVSVDAGAAEAGLKKLEADFSRAMADIDRQRAEAHIGADISELDREVAEVKAKIKDLSAQQADPRVALDDDLAKAEMKLLKSELDALDRRKVTLRADASQLRAANKEARISSKAQAEMSNQYLRTQRAIGAVEKARAKESEGLLRNNADVARLRETYAKTAGELERIQTKTGRPGGIFHTDSERRAMERLGADLALTEHKIRALGGTISDIDPDLERHQGLLGRWANSLSTVRLQMGFFSATLRQLGVGVIALGPLITGLIGAGTSIIGVFGTGAAGALSVASAAAAGFGLSALGIGLVLKPVVNDIKSATTASKAYHDAVLKYGKGSEEAKSAQEKLNQTLKGISPTAREAIKGLGSMKDQWDKLTAPARASLFDAFGDSIKTAKALLPSFARETTATTAAATKGWGKWMAALRSPEAKAGIKELMSNFRESLPGVMAGLQSIGAMFGRISVSASKTLPSLSRGFQNWANSLEKSVGGGDALDAKIQRLVGHMKDIGHLAQASGSAIASFFNLSADSGDNLVRSLTKVISGWNQWMNTAEGKQSLRNFFSESADEAKNFFAALGNLTQLLFQLGRATAPISDGMVKLLGVIGDIVQAGLKLPAVGTGLKVIGAALAGLFIVNKARSFASAITDAARAIGLLNAASATTSLSSGGGLLGGLFGRGKTAATTVKETEIALEAERAAAAGAAAETGIFSALLAPEVLIPAGAVAALIALGVVLEDSESQWNELGKEYKQTSHEFDSAINTVQSGTTKYNSALHEQRTAAETTAAARHHLLKVEKEGGNTAERVRALSQLASAERKQAATQRAVGVQNQQTVKSSKDTLSAAKANVQAAKERVKASQEEKRLSRSGSGKPSSVLGQGLAGAHREEGQEAKRAAESEKELAEAQREVVTAERALNLSLILHQRQLKGLDPLTQKTVAGLKEMQQVIGQQATRRIGNFVNPKDVEQVTNLSNRLSKLGRGSQVKNIDVKSKGADETIGKLQRLQKQTQKVEGSRANIKIGANDQVAQSKLKRLGALSQKVSGSKQTIHILANSSSAEQAIQRLQAHLHQVASQKYQATMSAIDRTQPGWESAYHHLREKASAKYQADITAVDHASSVAHKSGSAVDAVGKKHAKAVLEASNSQAIGSINAVNAALAALNGAHAKAVLETETVHRNVTINETKGGSRAAGGPSAYFAVGGPAERVVQRASETAVVEPGGRSRKIGAPRMLVGEEAPNHPEYVIATNPAYRRNNRVYLRQAADDLGMDVVPAHKRGKGRHKKKKGKGRGAGKGSGSADPGPPPYKKQSKKHHTVKKHRFAPQSVSELNTAENQLSNEEGAFNAELGREEQEITNKKRTAWDFGTLKGYLNREEALETKIIGTLLPAITKASNAAYNEANNELRGPLSAKKVHAANKVAANLAKEYSTMQAPNSPSKKSGESDAAYAEKKKAYANQKKAYDHAKAVKKANQKEAAAYAKQLERERTEALQQKADAAQELKEVRQEVRVEHETSLKELNTETTNVSEIEADPTLAPYYQEPDKSKTSEQPTIGEQTATLSQAREQLFNESGSNIREQGGAAPGTSNVSAFGSAAARTNAFAPGGVTSPSAFASPVAGPGRNRATAQAERHAAASSTPPPAASTVNNNVTNNFAAPPPDPHTWTRQQQFEIGALS